VSLFAHFAVVLPRRWGLICSLFGCCVLFAAATARGADETYPTLTVGPDTYTNVTILNKTRRDIFVRHAHGMANIKVNDLDLPTQNRLGYQIEQPPPSTFQQVIDSPNRITQLESNTRVQEFEEQLMARSGGFFERLDEATSYSVVACIVLLYLLFCFLCRCICVKTSNPPSALIWLPLLKQIPLFKAAGMSPKWILSNFIPPLFLIAYIIWCFKIVRARAKKGIYSVMLLLPVTNVLAFVYLALSASAAEDGQGGHEIITLSPSPRRDVA